MGTEADSVMFALDADFTEYTLFIIIDFDPTVIQKSFTHVACLGVPSSHAKIVVYNRSSGNTYHLCYSSSHCHPKQITLPGDTAIAIVSPSLRKVHIILLFQMSWSMPF